MVRTDAVVVMGVNDGDHRPREHRVVSTASPLVLAVAPLLQVLHTEFGVERGVVTTTCGDVRLAGLETVLPDLSGRIDVAGVDVASGTTSFVDLSLLLARVTDVDDVNAALRIAARGRPALALRYSERPVLAEDVAGDPASAVIDSTLTRASGELVKVVARFDPVWAQAHRLADAAGLVGDRLEPSSLPAVYRPAAPDVVLAPVASIARGPVRMITARPSPAASLRLSNGFEERQVGDRWVIRARARGLAPRDLDLRLGECTLTLDTRQGRSPRLHQVFSVPEGLDPRDVTVRLEDDVLCIEMPLSAALSGAR